MASLISAGTSARSNRTRLTTRPSTLTRHASLQTWIYVCGVVVRLLERRKHGMIHCRYWFWLFWFGDWVIGKTETRHAPCRYWRRMWFDDWIIRKARVVDRLCYLRLADEERRYSEGIRYSSIGMLKLRVRGSWADISKYIRVFGMLGNSLDWVCFDLVYTWVCSGSNGYHRAV